MGSKAVERLIHCMEEVFRNKNEQPPCLSAETALDQGLGLDSLDYAELVVRLEQEFGFDPFSRGNPTEIRTVKDLAALYQEGQGNAE